MQINKIVITNIRAIKSAKIVLGKKFNVFIGENASGKSSLLEAFTLLATGKSFRTKRFAEVIRNKHTIARVVGDINSNTVGIQKDIKKTTKISINNQKIAKQSELSKHLTTRIITPQNADLISSGSKKRRQFVDWGLFHVKQETKTQLQQFNRILKQRNILLKTSRTKEMLAWDKNFVSVAIKLSQMRQEYLQKIIDKFNQKYCKHLNLTRVEIEYFLGWNKNKPLLTILKQTLDQEKKAGVTKSGPHLADFKIFVEGFVAKSFLSRGQIKTFSFLLRLAQIDLFLEQTKKTLVVLIDDIGAEMDKKNQQIVVDCLDKLKVQVVITSIGDVETRSNNIKKFHVKHGCVVAWEDNT